VAVNCWVCPATIEAVAGETVILKSTPGVTVTPAVPEMLDKDALMVLAPVATPVASPWEPEALETVAVPVTDDDHVTESVMSCVVRLE
jgi:hypothetical protein